MTKRGTLESAGDQHLSDEKEDWQDAAARAVIECLGRPSQPKQILEDFVDEEHMSQNQGTAKFYKYKVFEVGFENNDRVIPGTPTIWLTPQEIKNVRYRPLSPTAIALANYTTIWAALGLER